jgi:uncharacterized membrane protein YgcG
LLGAKAPGRVPSSRSCGYDSLIRILDVEQQVAQAAFTSLQTTWLTKLRFTLLTLLAFMTLVAVALVTICRPNATVAEFVRTAVILSRCASLVVGFFSTGRTGRFTFTYGIFSLVLLGLSACPNVITLWVSQNAPYPMPALIPGGGGFGGGGVAGGGGGFAIISLVMTLTQYWFAVFVAIIAGAIAAGFRPSINDASEPKR